MSKVVDGHEVQSGTLVSRLNSISRTTSSILGRPSIRFVNVKFAMLERILGTIFVILLGIVGYIAYFAHNETFTLSGPDGIVKTFSNEAALFCNWDELIGNMTNSDLDEAFDRTLTKACHKDYNPASDSCVFAATYSPYGLCATTPSTSIQGILDSATHVAMVEMIIPSSKVESAAYSPPFYRFATSKLSIRKSQFVGASKASLITSTGAEWMFIADKRGSNYTLFTCPQVDVVPLDIAAVCGPSLPNYLNYFNRSVNDHLYRIYVNNQSNYLVNIADGGTDSFSFGRIKRDLNRDRAAGSLSMSYIGKGAGNRDYLKYTNIRTVDYRTTYPLPSYTLSSSVQVIVMLVPLFIVSAWSVNVFQIFSAFARLSSANIIAVQWLLDYELNVNNIQYLLNTAKTRPLSDVETKIMYGGIGYHIGIGLIVNLCLAYLIRDHGTTLSTRRYVILVGVISLTLMIIRIYLLGYSTPQSILCANSSYCSTKYSTFCCNDMPGQYVYLLLDCGTGIFLSIADALFGMYLRRGRYEALKGQISKSDNSFLHECLTSYERESFIYVHHNYYVGTSDKLVCLTEGIVNTGFLVTGDKIIRIKDAYLVLFGWLHNKLPSFIQQIKLNLSLYCWEIKDGKTGHQVGPGRRLAYTNIPYIKDMEEYKLV